MKLEPPKNEAEKRLRIFASYMGIANEVGWQTELSKILDVSNSAISHCIGAGKIWGTLEFKILEILGIRWWESPKLRGRASDFWVTDEVAVAKRVMGTREADFKDNALHAVGSNKAFLAGYLPHTSKDGKVATRQLVYSKIRQGKIPMEWRQPMFDFFQREGEKAGLSNYGYSVFFGQDYVLNEEEGGESMRWDEVEKREDISDLLDVVNTTLKAGLDDLVNETLILLGQIGQLAKNEGQKSLPAPKKIKGEKK